MKIFMKILTATTVIAVLLSSIPFESTCKELEKDVFRLHILANSDSESDQNLKLYVRDTILNEFSSMYDGVKTKADAIEITESMLPQIEKTAMKALREKDCDYEVCASVTNKFFDTRYYEDFTMPAGVYDTLEIRIGEAEGKNWWCVMYPTLCVGASSEFSMKENLSESEYNVIASENVVYKFKIVEYFEKVSSFFSDVTH